MSTRGAAILSRFQKIITRDWPARGPAETTTTFSLFREEVTGRTNLGETRRRWITIATDIPCIFNSVYSEVDERSLASPQGRLTQDMVAIYTAYREVYTGDNIRLEYDGRFYLVQSASYEGGLRRLLCDSSQNRLTSIPSG